MPHFYFDFFNGRPVHDKYGIKLLDLEAACAYAQKLADQVKKQDKRKGTKTPHTKIIVKDNKFKPVLTVSMKPSD
jgi:hypothetical protein